MYMYRLHKNQFKLSIIITISYNFLSLNQILKNAADLTSWTLNHIKTHKKRTKLSWKEGKQNSNRLETKNLEKFISNKQYNLEKRKSFFWGGAILEK